MCSIADFASALTFMLKPVLQAVVYTGVYTSTLMFDAFWDLFYLKKYLVKRKIYDILGEESSNEI